MTKLFNDFAVSDVEFSEIKKNARGGKYILLSDNNQDIYLQLPVLKAPFGINEPGEQADEFSVNLTLTEDVSTKLKELEVKVLDFVHKNSKELFGKVHDKTVLKDALFVPLVKYAKDEEDAKKYAPTMKLKVSTGKGKYMAEFYQKLNGKPTLVEHTEVKKGTSLETIIRVGQIWFINGKFGVSLKLEQAKIQASTRLTGYAFKDEEVELDVPDEEESEAGSD